MPDHDGVRILADEPYLGANREEKLDLHLPPRGQGAPHPARPLFVLVHGGGYWAADEACDAGAPAQMSLTEEPQ